MKHFFKLLFCCSLLSCGQFLQAQSLGPRVICSSSGAGTAGTIKINYTFGEPFYTSLSGSGVRLTQGFHQQLNACVAPTNPAISGTNAICLGASTTFTASATGTSANSTYSWAGPNSFSANTAVISNLTTAGTYTCTISNGSGCSVSASRTLTVNPLPNATISASGTLNLCTGGSVTLSTPTSSGQTYVWKNNGTAISGATANSYTASSAGSYTVTVNSSAGCSSTSSATVVTLNAIPASPSTLTGPTMICTLTSGTYTASPVSGAVSYTWTLPSGLTGTSTTNSINVAINDANFSSGAVTVKANTAYCTSNAKSLTIAKVPATPSTLTGSPTVTCGITSGSYTSSASTGATQYLWTLPTGFTGTSTTTTIATAINNSVFTTGNVTVKASNTCGISGAKTLAVSKVPFTPSTISGPSVTCGLTSATYSVSAGSNVSSYTWTLPAGITGTSTTNSITVTIDNSVFVSGNISVIANNACGSSPVKTLAVSKAPKIPTSITGPTQICGLTSATYTCTAMTGATSYNWSLPAGLTGTSTTNTITVDVNTALFTGGNVSVQAVNSCGNSAIKTLAISKLLPASSSISGPSFICGLTSATYTATAVTGATGYLWTLPSGLSGSSSTNSITVSINPANFSSGSISVQAINACGTGSLKSLALSKIPSIPTTLSGPSTAVCAGSTQTYSCTAMANASSYTWSVPSGAVVNSGQGTTSVSVTFPTTFTSGTVSVTANSSCGSSTAKSLSIASKPSTPGTITGTTTNLCLGGTYTYSIAAVSGATSYTWTAPSNCSISGNNNGTTVTIVVPVAFLSGTLSVVANNACGASSPKMLTLNGSPATPTTLTGLASVCPSSSGHVYSTTPVTGATTYLWTVPTGASIVSGNGSNTITVNWGTVAGSVTVKAGNTCSNYSTAKTLTVGLATCRMGEEEIPESDPSVFANIRLYPNPLNNFLTIEINANETTTKTIRVTDMLGKILIEEVKVVTSGQNTFMFDLSGYASGLYMVILNSGNSQQVFKVVKE